MASREAQHGEEIVRTSEELERALRQKLAAAPPSDAPVAAWLCSAAISCGMAVVCCTERTPTPIRRTMRPS